MTIAWTIEVLPSHPEDSDIAVPRGANLRVVADVLCGYGRAVMRYATT